ncbi:neuronal acetylcholine receptor subunit alpha-3-like [Mercenaria mercenaria]|uniref:neuronal acetylcholine receptor subunit alpha-3-like n=1 Tax=Mercenaria mercenaria TaxID=6596 RepID=UPI00234EA284|nr:neuronal acetylcholine receptor subunit alpha-3-like [Mercenaria mercenaria]
MMILYILVSLATFQKLALSVNISIGQNDSFINEVFYMMPTDYDFDLVFGDVTIMKNLFKDLLDDYDTRIRPIQDQSLPVNVSAQFVPMSLLEFDTVGQKFSILGYFRVWWKDELLTWKEEEYAHTNNVKIPTKEMWTPSLIILKTVNGDGVVGNMETDIAKVSSAGDVQWVPEGIYSVVCDVNIKYYPFDKQICTITFYVSDETVTSVVLSHHNEVTLDEYTENTAWKIMKIVKKQYRKYNSNFIDIQFHVQRRAGFTTFTLIMPLLMLAFLNVCIFLVPIGSGEKGSFAITIFLSYGIFITIISNTLPQNSLQISYFVLFITILLFLSVLSVFYTVLQAKLVAVMGNQPCPWKFLTPKNENKVMASTDLETDELNKVENGEITGTDKPYTWAMVFQRLDTIIFILFLTLVILCTFSFFVLMIQN